jgi:hypothetical protein
MSQSRNEPEVRLIEYSQGCADIAFELGKPKIYPIMLNSVVQILQATILSPWQSNENFVSRKIKLQQKMHQDPLYRPRSHVDSKKPSASSQTQGKAL